jgi:hypothetical protein
MACKVPFAGRALAGIQRGSSSEAVLRHKPGGGNRNGDVADKLFIAEETVKVYNRDIL